MTTTTARNDQGLLFLPLLLLLLLLCPPRAWARSIGTLDFLRARCSLAVRLQIRQIAMAVARVAVQLFLLWVLWVPFLRLLRTHHHQRDHALDRQHLQVKLWSFTHGYLCGGGGFSLMGTQLQLLVG